MPKTNFVDGNPAQGIQGSIVLAAFLNKIFSHRHDGLDQDGSAPIDYAVDSGVANAYAIALTPALTAYIPGLPICFKASNSNTGASTLNINGLGPLPIKKYGDIDPIPGDIMVGEIIVVIYDGADFLMVNQPANQDTPVGTILSLGMNTPPAGWLKCNGANISRTAYARLFAALVKSAVATISIATPAVVTWNNHGRSANDPVKFTTTGALPTGLIAGTTYYVVGSSITTNTFQVSATPGGAAIATSGTQSGTHTAIHAPWGDGDGSTTFTMPDLRGEFLRGWDDARGIDGNRVFGSSQLDAMQGHKHTLAAAGNTNNGAGSGGLFSSGGGTDVGSPITDGTNGTPRTAAETRPRNISAMYCIKY